MIRIHLVLISIKNEMLIFFSISFKSLGVKKLLTKTN
jgi:hypothetical protein